MPIRITGPYEHGSGFRFRIYTGPGTFTWARTGRNEERALRLAEARAEGLQKQIDLTVGGLCVKYLGRLAERGCKPMTVKASRLKLASLIGAHEQIEAASHHKALDHARSTWKFGVRQGLVKTNPWLEVDKVGKANRGKLQLRGKESRSLANICVENALQDDGALAIAMCLFMGLRKSEVEKRVVRDVDTLADGERECTVLVVEDAKSKNGERRPEIPDVLLPAIRLRCAGRAPNAPLLTTATGRALYEKYIEHALRKYTKMAGVPRVTSHGLRGGFASALVEAGALTHLVAAAMGHGSFERMTARHYATEDSLQKAKDTKRLRHLKSV